MIELTPDILISESEIVWTFARSGGPGGQNVNKVASKAALRWNLRESLSLAEEVKQRLLSRLSHRITVNGELIIISQRFRDQTRNREDCLDKLRELVKESLAVRKTRKKTRPHRGSKEARLREKKLRSQSKQSRQRPANE